MGRKAELRETGEALGHLQERVDRVVNEVNAHVRYHDRDIRALESRLAALEAKGEGEGGGQVCTIVRCGHDSVRIIRPNGKVGEHDFSVGSTITVQREAFQ